MEMSNMINILNTFFPLTPRLKNYVNYDIEFPTYFGVNKEESGRKKTFIKPKIKSVALKCIPCGVQSKE